MAAKKKLPRKKTTYVVRVEMRVTMAQGDPDLSRTPGKRPRFQKPPGARTLASIVKVALRDSAVPNEIEYGVLDLCQDPAISLDVETKLGGVVVFQPG